MSEQPSNPPPTQPTEKKVDPIVVTGATPNGEPQSFTIPLEAVEIGRTKPSTYMIVAKSIRYSSPHIAGLSNAVSVALKEITALVQDRLNRGEAVEIANPTVKAAIATQPGQFEPENPDRIANAALRPPPVVETKIETKTAAPVPENKAAPAPPAKKTTTTGDTPAKNVASDRGAGPEDKKPKQS